MFPLEGNVRDLFDFSEHKLWSHIHEPESGLRGFIAIHSDMGYGKSLGGTRMYPYEKDSDALIDALRLSKGMTFKAALASVRYGGAKGVIIGDPKKDKTEALLRAYGRRINLLNGAFITGEDVGISVS